MQSLVPTAALPKYFTSEWSFAQFRMQPEDSAVPSVVGFGPTASASGAGAIDGGSGDNVGTLFVVTAAGSFYKAVFDTQKGGQASQESFFKFALVPQPEHPPTM